MSIIIPAFNEEHVILRLISSLNDQTYKNFEVVIIDNNSEDNTVKVVKNYQKKINYPLHILTERKQGPGNARKKGMDWVITRLSFFNNKIFLKHVLVITDADVFPPDNWLERIWKNFNDIPSGALAGTHGAAESIDEIIADKIGIKNYFNKIPLVIEFLSKNNIGKIKMSGPNSAFEIEAYAAAGGIKQPFDNKNKRIGLREVNQLCENIRANGYPILPMNVRVVASRRRHLLELIKNESMYFPSGYNKKNRFYCVREDEEKLLEIALEKVPKEDWLNYQNNSLKTVLSNMIFLPLLNNELDVKLLSKILNKEEFDKFETELENLNKDQSEIINRFIQKWSLIFGQEITRRFN